MAAFRVPGPTFAFPQSVLIPSAAVGVLAGLWLRMAGTDWSAWLCCPRCCGSIRGLPWRFPAG